MSTIILSNLAKRLGAPKKKDDGYKFSSVEDMLLFLDIANRFPEVEVSEDFFLMSVLITPTPIQVLKNLDGPVKVDVLVQEIRQGAAEMLRESPSNDWAQGFTIDDD